MTFSNISGWIVLDKGYGLSSTKSVSTIKKHLGIKKAGHLGTLDPLATGVLPVALGEGTKTIPYINSEIKEYKFTVRWGISTSTDDLEGEVIAKSTFRPRKQEIRNILKKYIGTIKQNPPKYSAIKINGERAYNLSRRGLDFSLVKRNVEIKSIHVTNIIDKDHASFELVCGKGTYVRSLARDIALDLGTLGHVVDIRRTKVGLFTLSNSICLDNKIESEKNLNIKNKIISIDEVLKDMPSIPIEEEEAKKIKAGQRIPLNGINKNSLREKIIKLKFNGCLVSIAYLCNGYILPRRNFNV